MSTLMHNAMGSPGSTPARPSAANARFPQPQFDTPPPKPPAFDGDEDEIQKEERGAGGEGRHGEPVSKKAKRDDTATVEDEDDGAGEVRRRKVIKVPSSLFDLPCKNPSSFATFCPDLLTPAYVYIPSPSDILPTHYTIPLSRKRCLIRALSSSPSPSGPPPRVGTKRPHPSSSTRREKWLCMDHSARRECLRVALDAAHIPGTPDTVPDSDETRRRIARTVNTWSLLQLKEYITRAGMQIGGMPKHQMIALVQTHMSPDSGSKDSDDRDANS